jgi:NAD(P)-dependent dehydrogenase (short-subunit alcohol dehydrogenase family)
MSGSHSYIIVGASSGIGFELARKLSGGGHQVIALSRTLGRLSELNGVRHITFDVTKDDFPAEDIPDKLNGLAYCPGSIRLRPFARLTPEEFMEDYRINLLGAVVSIKGCLGPLKKADPSSAIVLFSTVAVGTGMPFHASIASAKGAVEGFTRSLAAELAPRVRVNAIAPSLTDTPLANALLADENKRKAAADRHPMKRTGTPLELANLAEFLITDQSSWITGQIYSVDGGMSAVRTFK